MNNGGYKGDTLSNLSIDFYDKNASSAYNAVLSRDFSNFYKNNANSAKLNPLQTDHHFGQSIYLYTLGVRAGRSRNQDLSDTFHSNKDDQTIKNATKLSDLIVVTVMVLVLERPLLTKQLTCTVMLN